MVKKVKDLQKPTKGIALYHKLEEILTEKIKNNQLQENEQIPSEKELCEIYGVSRTTVRQAILEMEKKGYIFKVHGKGTFVAPRVFRQDLLKFYSFTEEMKKLGMVPSSTILEFGIQKATETIAEKLNILPKTKIYKITRLRLADEMPIMLEYTYLPAATFLGLTEEILAKDAMYEIFKEKYSMTLTKAVETFKPAFIDKATAKILALKEKSVGMQLERVTYSDSAIIEYTFSIVRGDKFEYTVVLE